MKVEFDKGFRITGMKSSNVDKNQTDFILPLLWDTFYSTTWNLLNGYEDGMNVLGVMMNQKEDEFDYLIGIRSGQKFGMPEYVIPASDYAKFSAKGTLPDVVQTLRIEVENSIQNSGTWEKHEPVYLEQISKKDTNGEVTVEAWLSVKKKDI